MRRYLVTLTISIVAASLFAQLNSNLELLAYHEPETCAGESTEEALTGSIRGKISDASTGDELIGANVFLTGTTTGTITDFNGNFSLNDLPAGTCSVTASGVSYEPQVFEDVEVPAGEVIVLNANLGLSSRNIKEVVVTSRKRERTEAAVLVLKKKLTSVLDGISAQQISRLDDSDAASALKVSNG